MDREARGVAARSSIANDRAALVTHPISETKIVDPHVVKSGAHRRCGTQSGPAAAFAMGHDVVAGAKPDPFQHCAQRGSLTNHPIIEMRQVPGLWQMAAAGTIARVLAGELRACARIEDMRTAVKLIPQRLPVDQPDRP
jgi:hypothetical protein